MRAYATELAVNLRKESLEQMTSPALKTKLSEMQARLRRCENLNTIPGWIADVCLQWVFPSVGVLPLWVCYWGSGRKIHAAACSNPRCNSDADRVEARDTGAYKKHTKLQADITAVEEVLAKRQED
jgi:hypothetical protein